MAVQNTTAVVLIDGVDVTEFAIEGLVTTRLNGASTATVKLPMTAAIGGAGSYLKVYFQTDTDMSPVLWHHGRCMTVEDSADENFGYTVYNSSDPLELWNWRPVRDQDGNLTSPTIIDEYIFGPQIIEQMLQNTDMGTGDAFTEGPHRLAIPMDAFATGTTDLSGTPTNWPMTMAELAASLISTGVVDIVVKPIEFDLAGNYGEIHVYNGDYGTDLSASVFFQYGMGLYNIRALRRNQDMSRMVNKLQYFLGPRVDQNHWTANITATQDFTKDFAFPGGLPEIDPSPCPYDAAAAPPYNVDVDAIRAAIAVSRGETAPNSGIFDPLAAGSFDVRMELRTYEDRNDEASLGYCLFKRLWLIESWLRLSPLNLVHITPTRDTAIGSFDIGDLVTVEANPDVRGGFSGVQRIYQYTITWDVDSVPAIGELQVSSDNEGFGT